jgi:hypothetical protein
MAIFLFGRKNLLLLAGGLAGTLLAGGAERAFRKWRPAAVGVLKEGFAFKEYVAGKLVRLKEDAEDIAAEAAYEYQRGVEGTADLAKRERELLARIETIVARKQAEAQTGKKEEQS